MDQVYIVGIAGGSASGKTTIVKMLQNTFTNNITVISHDSYYLAHNELPYKEREKLNYDHPSSFETSRMAEDIKKLKNGETVHIPVYDFSIHNRVQNGVEIIEPKKVVIVEGILILESEALRDLMDIKVYIDAAADERLIRRIRRDTVERARTVEFILSQYENTVKPMHEQFIEPSKKYADIIIPRGGENSIGISILKEYINILLG